MDKRITIEHLAVTGDGHAVNVTGWLEDWIVAIYDAMTEEQQRAIRKELRRREEREKRGL